MADETVDVRTLNDLHAEAKRALYLAIERAASDALRGLNPESCARAAQGFAAALDGLIRCER